MDVTAIFVSAVLAIGAPDFTVTSWELNITPVIHVNNDFPCPSRPGCAIGNVIFTHPRHSTPQLRNHETEHVKHFMEFGPAFWGAYAATLGQPFEDYNTRDPADDSSWPMYESEEIDRCPAIKLSNDKGFQVYPCFRW